MQFSVNSLLTKSRIRYETPGRSPRPFPCVQNNLHHNCFGHTSTYLQYSESTPRERNVAICRALEFQGLWAFPLGNISWRLNSSRPFPHQYLDRCPQAVLKVPNPLGLLGSAGTLYCRCPGSLILSLLMPARWYIKDSCSPGYFFKRFKRQLKVL